MAETDARSSEQTAAFEAFVADHREKLIVVANRIVHHSELAEDVVQDALAAVWRRLDQTPPKRLKPYVYRAVQNQALKLRVRRRETVSLDQTDPLVAKDSPDDHPIDPIALEHALAGLPSKQQAVLRMKYYTGLTFRQIAEVLAISTHTAASRCRYGLNTLRKRFKSHQN